MTKLYYLVLSLYLTSCCLYANAITLSSSEKQIGLLELYTSEGCSSCPPADIWLSSLKQHKDLWQTFIPIALHVDYWNYLGWGDPFASNLFGQRQRQYKQQGSVNAVYTPGFIYNGQEWRQWYYKRTLDLPPSKTAGILKLHIKNNIIDIEFTPSQPHEDTLYINTSLLGFGLETDVKAGENKGKTLTHDFVALSHNKTIMTSTNGQYTARLPLPHSRHTAKYLGITAWVNTTKSLIPLQAVGGLLD